MNTALTKSQFKTMGPIFYTEQGQKYKINVNVRYDDECGNGHNTFAITADIRVKRGTRFFEDACGCLHDAVARHFPKLKPLIKWHLMSSEEPLHYVANSMYHALRYGPTHAYLRLKDEKNDLTGCLQYGKIEEMKAKAKTHPDIYSIEIQESSSKEGNLNHARSSAIWPNADWDDFTKEKLEARLPKLVANFRKDIEMFGFIY